MPLHDQIIDSLRKTHSGDPWYGPSTESLIAGLSASSAASHPIEGGHSIWEVLLHMIAWQNEVARRLGGSEPALPEEGDWEAITDSSDAAWEQAKAMLSSSTSRLVETTSVCSDRLRSARWNGTIARACNGRHHRRNGPRHSPAQCLSHGPDRTLEARPCNQVGCSATGDWLFLRILLDAEGVKFNSRWQRHRNVEKKEFRPCKGRRHVQCDPSRVGMGSLSIPVALPPAIEFVASSDRRIVN